MSKLLDGKLGELSEEGLRLWKMRHSAEHVLTYAMQRIFGKNAFLMAMGPATKDGFYFDFDGRQKFSLNEADFKKIELEMEKIVQEDLPFVRKEISATEAKKLFNDNHYKLELINEINTRNEKISIYYTGDEFADLCSGPHVNSTKEIGPFKLLSIAGAYWRGDENNNMLTRVYGTVFPTKKLLDEYINNIEEAKARDHRKIGKKLDLFLFSDLVGPGLPLYTHKGALIRRLLQNFVNEMQKDIGYEEVWTPQVTKADLFKVSGHYEKYKEDMFLVTSNYSKAEYFLKPMNCPMHTQIYASQIRSYRDLPVRIADFANLYRDEKPGELSGLTRLRAFSQDDGHCFCREDQIEAEFFNVAKIIKKAIAVFGMKYWIRLSFWDPKNKDKYLGSPKTWEQAQKTLKEIVEKLNVDYEEVEGEAAIYGPKLDFIAIDALGREWQISTIQLDFIQPERFDLKYADENGELKTPVMIHRAILGSPERFMGLLIEHFGGALPLWLSPIQVVVVPISQDQHEYAQSITDKFLKKGIRAENWNNSISMQKRIRRAEEQKVPYILVIGKKEVEEKMVSVRSRKSKKVNAQSMLELLKQLKKEIKNYTY